MFKYHCLNNISKAGLEKFSALYEETADIGEAQGILVRSAKMHDMEFSENLLAIARAGAGVNNIPLDRCAKEGIVVFNTPGANANAVKELVFTGMLLASRDIVEGVDWVRGNWKNPDIAKTAEKEKKQFAGTEIRGKKLGIIGLGAIGVRVANAAIDLGMEVYGYDPYVSVDAAWNLNRSVKHVSNVEEIYEVSDIITIHVPLLPSTKGMIGEAALEKMKHGVIIINMARDTLCDEKAIVEAIEEGRVRRYVSDFPNPTVAGKRGCITTPHLGASTAESEDKCARMAVEELQNYIENGNIINSVNYPNCNMGICQTPGRVAIFHANKTGMLTQFTAIFGSTDINIAELFNKAKGEVAYTMMDLDGEILPDTVEKLRAIDGVFRVRVIK
ncbi:MAG: phosphoglycerate dehydrogenase [Lachnospiraceae bacterium]|jgi:D-3-phosphoglycerate dehydrogenase|nr:phosphoglycerate dehydrogenase [Lachnospiraceae bacterium]